MFAKVLWVFVTVIVLFGVYTYAQLMSLVCLNCLCEITTGCNTTIGCDDTSCGPFSITKSFWVDAGKPPPNGKSSNDDDANVAYRECAKNIYCAGYTVQAYMAKHSRDCNGDGVIDCDDYVRLHRLGAYGCTGLLSNVYENRYMLCLQTFQHK
ncbi:lysozyme-like [Temnothorax curvispinosus]|uniref:lysozyme n=1 Tax=Temnothorax curvispinosus TaxID=300111 RepID=A0A6J1QLS4_9HYME|nr:lysozyme-like [Temnothorax curvispinosus]